MEQMFEFPDGSVGPSEKSEVPEKSKPYSLGELKELHLMILDMVRGDNGYTKAMNKSEIASVLGKAPATIGRIIESPLFQAELRRKTYKERGDIGPVKQFLQEYSLDLAAREVDIALNSTNEAVALSAIKDGLDRAGVDKSFTLKVIGIKKPENYSDEELRRVVAERLQKGVIDGTAVDADTSKD